jgi:outer membrane receptor protein involved in Fe transport
MKTANSVMRATVFLLAVLVSGAAWAQTSNGTLVGSITDPTGAVLPKATISAVSAAYGQPHETRSDPVGAYRLEGLQPGTYTVSISASGFNTLTVADVVINGSLTTTINGKLALAAAQQTIEVHATAAQAIDTQSGQLGGNISRQELAELPYGSLNPAELALTLPGVHDIPDGQGAVQSKTTNGFGFSVNGTRPRANNFLIDGQDNNDYGIAGQAFQPLNYGAIQEVTILTNSYGAEYGRGGGSVTNYIFKSGTNNFHGDLWEINRNSALAAIPAEDAVVNPISKNPFDNENTFGFDVGGPIKKDKLFAFGTAQWDRERQLAAGPNGFNLPTAAGIATLKSLLPNPNISLLLAAIGPLVGTPTSPSTTVALGSGRPDVEIGPFQVKDVRLASNSYEWNYRMDWHFTDRDTLTGSVIRSNETLIPDNFANPNALPNFQTEQGGPAQIYRGQWTRVISSNLLNELRLSYNDINFSFGLTPETAASPMANIPWTQFGNDINFPAIGVDSTFPQSRGHKMWEVQDALSYTRGNHTLKVGGDLTFLRLHDELPLNTRGTLEYNFGGGFTSLGNFIDDFIGQNPGSISRGFGNPNVNSRATMFAPYVQDTWRIKSNLTVNLGLRYEYWGALANVLPFPAFNIGQGIGALNITDPANYADAFSFKQVPDKRNFAPRIGLAYTPRWGGFLTGEGKTTIRAGYGIFYDGLFSNILDNSAESQPNTLGGTAPSVASGRGTANASTAGIGAITPTPDPTFFNQSMQSNLHNPLTQQWNLNLQRELPLGLVMTLAYVGTRGEHLFTNQDYNPAMGLDSTFNYAFVNPIFNEIGIRTNAADSRYDSGQLELERTLHTLVLRAAYTFSKYRDDSSEIFSVESTPSVDLPSYSQDLTNQKSDWGHSIFDQRHRFTVAYVWQIPYFHRNALLKALTDQWQWSGVATLETGTPNTVEVGFDSLFNFHSNARPDLSNPAAPLDMLGIDGGNLFAGFTPGVIYDFVCATTTFGPCPSGPASDYHFIVPAQTVNSAGLIVGPPGNVPRNSIHGPGQVFFDTAVQRDFPVHFWKVDNQKLSLRIELFNAFNHPNLFTPSYTMTDTNFNNTAITINGGRQIKLWLKYSF